MPEESIVVVFLQWVIILGVLFLPGFFGGWAIVGFDEPLEGKNLGAPLGMGFGGMIILLLFIRFGLIRFFFRI